MPPESTRPTVAPGLGKIGVIVGMESAGNEGKLTQIGRQVLDALMAEAEKHPAVVLTTPLLVVQTAIDVNNWPGAAAQAVSATGHSPRGVLRVNAPVAFAAGRAYFEAHPGISGEELFGRFAPLAAGVGPPERDGDRSVGAVQLEVHVGAELEDGIV